MTLEEQITLDNGNGPLAEFADFRIIALNQKYKTEISSEK